jgi:hypothetical protein
VALVVDAVVLDPQLRAGVLVVVLRPPPIAVGEQRSVRGEIRSVGFDIRPRPLSDAHDSVARVGLGAGGADLSTWSIDVSSAQCECHGYLDAAPTQERGEHAIRIGLRIRQADQVRYV